MVKVRVYDLTLRLGLGFGIGFEFGLWLGLDIHNMNCLLVRLGRTLAALRIQSS